VRPDQVPRELRASAQWFLWRWLLNDDPKWAKVPIWAVREPTRRLWNWWPIPSSDSLTWRTFDEAAAAVRRVPDFGLAFRFAPANPFAFIDLDDCRDPATGEVEPWALDFAHEFGSYTEVTTSGRGLHIIIAGEKPGPLCRTTVNGRSVEIYSTTQYAAVTGHRLELPGLSARVEDRQDQLTAFYTRLFADKIDRATRARAARDERAAAGPSLARSFDDDELVERIRDSRGAIPFSRLFDQGEHNGDKSGADFALASILVWWCRGDAAQIERIMRASALARQKFDRGLAGTTYIAHTIQNAINDHPGGYYGDQWADRAGDDAPALDLDAILAELGVPPAAVAELLPVPAEPTPPPAEPGPTVPAVLAVADSTESRATFRAQLDSLVKQFPESPRRCHCEQFFMADGHGHGALGFFADGGWRCCCTCCLRNRIQKKEHFHKLLSNIEKEAAADVPFALDGDCLPLDAGCFWVYRRPHSPEWYTPGPRPKKPKEPRKRPETHKAKLRRRTSEHEKKLRRRIKEREATSRELRRQAELKPPLTKRPERRDRIWEHMRGEITANATRRGAKANYVKVFVEGVTPLVVVSTERFDGAEPMTAAEAFKVLAEAIDSIPPDARAYRPIATSRAAVVDEEIGEPRVLSGWEVPRLKDQKTEWTMIAKATRSTDLDAMEDARAEGAELVTSFDAEATGPSGSDPNLRRFLKWRLPTTGVYVGLSPDERARLFAARMNTRRNGFDPDRYCRSVDAIIPSGDSLSLDDVYRSLSAAKRLAAEVACSP
jgi:putative DNA primase/helicase